MRQLAAGAARAAEEAAAAAAGVGAGWASRRWEPAWGWGLLGFLLLLLLLQATPALLGVASLSTLLLQRAPLEAAAAAVHHANATISHIAHSHCVHPRCVRMEQVALLKQLWEEHEDDDDALNILAMQLPGSYSVQEVRRWG